MIGGHTRWRNMAARNTWFFLVVAGATTAWLFTAPPSSAQGIPGYPPDVYAYDPRETALLPSYCKHTQAFREQIPGGDDAVAIGRWEALMGPENFLHMHHYCLALMHLNRARILARDSRTRNYHFGRAVDEIDYVLRNTRRDFAMLPEILTRRGEALAGVRRGPQAVADFQQAIALKPDYWPAYAQLSDYYRAEGNLEAARQALEEGLRHASDARPLQRRLDELKEAAKATVKGRPR